MRLCFICKYPPIEGGVSTAAYWLARGLAERGHEIHVVTNSEEVEEEFRVALEPEDAHWYESEFPKTGGLVRVYQTQTFSRRAMGYIPASNPFVSKLAGLGTQVVRRNGCQAIFTDYFEPYAVAGWLVSQWTDRPLITKHAGSDLERLFRAPGLATTYCEILRSSRVVVTQPALMPRFLAMGVSAERLAQDVPYSLPSNVFNPDQPPLAPALRDAGAPTIGIYGKTGPSKGTLDLIEALGRLASEGVRFNLFAMIGELQGRRLADALAAAGVADRTTLLPFLPNWKVPGFIRVCTAVCFLERDFPVELHGPIVPREVLACGTCLVVSSEIEEKQRYRHMLVRDKNVVVVKDPRAHDDLASALRTVVTNPARARAIGRRGHDDVSRWIEDYPAFVNGWESIFSNLTESGRVMTMTSLNVGDLIHPALLSTIKRRCPSGMDETDLAASTDFFGAAIRFCDFAIARLAGQPDLLQAVRYQRTRLVTASNETESVPAFPVSDRLGTRDVSEESVAALRPVRGASVVIEEFDYDLEAIFGASTGRPVQARLDPEHVIVLFHRSPNFVLGEMLINDATRELVTRADGRATTSELIESMYGYFGVRSGEERVVAKERTLAALDRLYKAGIIVFGEATFDGRWVGGSIPPIVIDARDCTGVS